jgi:hypothetical protein
LFRSSLYRSPSFVFCTSLHFFASHAMATLELASELQNRKSVQAQKGRTEQERNQRWC